MENGPYSIIRHPIYAGLPAKAVRSVVTGGFFSIVAIAALVSSITAYCIQLHQEEDQLTIIFASKYNQYQKETYKLLPYIF